MPSQRSQPHILAPIPAFGLSQVFRLRPGADPRPVLRELQDGFAVDWGVVGLGEPLIRALGATVPGLRTFPALSGPGCTVPATQQALWIRLCADDRSTIFDREERVRAMLDPAFEIEDSLDTFRYHGKQDLTGYEDGTENPSPQDSVGVALLAGEDAGLAGSSFVAIQRWNHDLAFFHSHTREECDAMMGRRLEDNEEIDDAPESAHVKRSAQESFAPEAFMVRRSMPWVRGEHKGLEFIAFGHSLVPFEQVMRRMMGLDDGIVDALFRFSRAETGGYYWCPPVTFGRLALGRFL